MQKKKPALSTLFHPDAYIYKDADIHMYTGTYTYTYTYTCTCTYRYTKTDEVWKAAQ